MHGWFEDGKTSPGPGGRVAGWPWGRGGRGGRGAAGWGVWDEPRTIILTRILGCAEGDGGRLREASQSMLRPQVVLL